MYCYIQKYPQTIQMLSHPKPLDTSIMLNCLMFTITVTKDFSPYMDVQLPNHVGK